MNIDSLNMESRQVDVLLSDYDGTLCPTTAVRGDSSHNVGTIPQELEQLLFYISKHIPLCIISSKDFAFLHKRTRFANILSCVLGIETVIHNSHHSSNEIDNSCIRSQDLIANSHSLMDNSKLLYDVVKILQTHNYENIIIEEKYTSNREILIGLTIDYRHLEDWQSFKENKEPMLRETIQRGINTNLSTNTSSKNRPFIQVYSSHPFLDVYGVECDKGLAFDSILSHLKGKDGGTNIMYLGDSENDNPAFRRSDISIGIHSDTRLNPILDCKYMLEFNQLPIFLKGLTDNNLMFSDELFTIR
jgi:HAD superfamily hydrolase (TIGR01484 family)